MSSKLSLSCAVISANTGADAIQKAPIVDYDTGIRCLRIGDLSNNRKFDDWGFTQIEDKYYENFKLLKDDIFIARTGNTIGVNTIIKLENIKAVFNNGMIRLRIDKEKFDPLFIYYIISSKQMQEYIQSIAYGTSTQPNMKINDLLGYEFQNISLTGQKKISHILSTLDDKIELNRKMNQTLEEMASAIFKSWFVDFDPVLAKANCEGEAELENIAKDLGISKAILDLFPSEFEESELGMIPKGWEVKTISSFGQVLTGKTPPTAQKENYGDKYPFITIPDMHNQIYITRTERYLSDIGNDVQKNKLIPKNSLIVSCIATVGLVSINSEDSHTKQQINSIICNEENLFYLYFMLKNMKETLIMYGSAGTATLNVNKSTFETMDIIKSSDILIQRFFQLVNPIFNSILENTKQIQTFEKTRDTLLPKLLSGEIDVSELDLQC